MEKKSANLGTYRGKIIESENLKQSLLLTATQLSSNFFSQKHILTVRRVDKKTNSIVRSQLYTEKRLLYKILNNDDTIIYVLDEALENGFDINKQYTYEEMTLLHYGVSNQNVKLVQYLIMKGANKLIKDTYNKTPLEMALVMQICLKQNGEDEEKIQKIIDCLLGW